MEYQADALAGLILVPALREVERVGLDLDGPDTNEVAKSYVTDSLGRAFQVSAQTVQIRMDKDELWPAP